MVVWLFVCCLLRKNSAADDMQCKSFLVHLVAVLYVHQSQRAAASGTQLSSELVTSLCADASLDDFIEASEACQMAESLGSGGTDCWANLDAVLQLCLDEAAAAGQLEITSLADKLKRNRNRFLGKRSAKKRDASARNNFLGKREAAGRLRSTINTFLRKEMEAEKRNRNKFLGKRTQQDGFEFDLSPTEKRSRNKFLGKRDDLERSRMVVFGNGEYDKRGRNRFLGKKDQTMTNSKRSRNKFLGKRREQAKKHSE